MAQHMPSIEKYYLQDDGQWFVDFSSGIDSLVRLLSLDIEIPLEEVYAGVEFPSEALAKSATGDGVAVERLG